MSSNAFAQIERETNRIEEQREMAREERKASEDRELLEWAAKAHGGLQYIQKRAWIHVDEAGNRGLWWKPLDDDGDALRLAVKLRLSPMIGRNGTSIRPIGYPTSKPIRHNNDPYSATRRAITRAAAEIGKAMEGKK